MTLGSKVIYFGLNIWGILNFCFLAFVLFEISNKMRKELIVGGILKTLV